MFDITRLRAVAIPLLSGALLAAGPAWAQAGDAYEIDAASGQVIIGEVQHWESWKVPVGTTVITADGSVRPHFWRKNTNAALDIVDHLRAHPPDNVANKRPEDITPLDAVTAGSNPEDVVFAIDGDTTTYWEPDPLAPGVDIPALWWFNIDLGRIVLAKKLVLKFVDESMGDPFLLFDVLSSTGEKPASAVAGKSFEYRSVFRGLQPNKSQRLFEIDLAGPDEAEELLVERIGGSLLVTQTTGLVGDDQFKRVIRYLQVVIRASDQGKGREVSEEEYERLLQDSPDDAGAVEYVQVLADGGEIPVSADVYELLEPERRGGIRHYIRERPRLAELEVWSPGDDIAYGTLARGGSIENSTLNVVWPPNVIDGDITTYERVGRDRATPVPTVDELTFDLGSFFWLDTQRMTSGALSSNRGHNLRKYRLQVSDGSREVDGGLAWTTVVDIDGRGARIYVAGHDFEPVKARFFRLHWDVEYRKVGDLSSTKIGELQLFGEGYGPEVALTSDLIRLGGSRNLVSVEWDADTPPGTGVVLQTRTGAKLDTVYHYFKVIGKDTTEVTEESYNKLRVGKGPIVPEVVASESWDPWSARYEDPSGSPITSPSPREFLKLQATLLSDHPDRHATLNEIRLNFDDPAARVLLGEVTPREVTSLGEAQDFALFVELDTLEQGFDELLVRPPDGMYVDYGALYAGRATAFAEGADFSNLAVDGVEVLAEGDSLHISFPAVESAAVDAIRLEFTGTLYSLGGRLRASLRRSDVGKGYWQRVDDKVARTSLTLVSEPKRRDLFEDLSIQPEVFTPNGDGVNDEVVVNATLFMASANTGVEVEVFDLAGRLVRRIVEQREVSTGPYAIRWDGKDDDENLVPPGVYTLRLSLEAGAADTDLRSREMMRTVAVAY